jgi:hypothetical protein
MEDRMTHKNEHHLNLIYTTHDYDQIIAYRQAFGLADNKKWTEHCKALLMLHIKQDMDDLRVKFGCKD